MADYSARFYKTFILKKSIIFVKLKKQNVNFVHMNFPCSPKKSNVPHMTFLEFRLLFERTFLVKIKTLVNLIRHTFTGPFYQTNYAKIMNNFGKIKEKNCFMCTWNFLVRQESHMYHIRRSWDFWLTCKMTKMYIRLYFTDPAIFYLYILTSANLKCTVHLNIQNIMQLATDHKDPSIRWSCYMISPKWQCN